MSLRTTRPGYALALTLLVMLTALAMLTAMVERLGAQSLAVRRQTDQYQEHHGKRGLEEVLDAWLSTVQLLPLAELTREDPHVLDLVLADGSVVEISLSDGQTTVLSDLTGLNSEDARDGRSILEALRRIAPDRLAGLTRPAGPVQISAQNADPDVLRALILSVLDGGDPEPIASAILARRRETVMTLAEVAGLTRQFDMTPDQRVRFNRLLKPQSDVWRLRAVIRPPRIPGEPARISSIYEGLVRLEQKRDAMRGNRFLSFEPVEPSVQ
ncbi:MAG: hypothetical protein H6811_03175 [Phycisphaeraceae bacterium]|nr:hypothetical protein [Phycisphaeraceae bacterium]